MPHDGESLDEYMRAARLGQGVTLDGLVRSTGLSTSTIRKIEDGRTKNPGIFTLATICDALTVPREGLARVRPSARE